MEFIDTHCHICDPAFRDDEQGYIDRALEAGVSTMLQADVDSTERAAMYVLTERQSSHLRPMLGLYPGSVDKNWEQEMLEVEKWIGKGAVAIGEIGLDYHYGAEFADEQKQALRVQLELASRLDLPVNIHLREATADFLEIVRECRHLGLRGNLHAYSGSYETFLELQRLGDWRIGVGGVVTFKKASLAEVVRRVPLERIVLETDAPYLSPVPYRGTRNESSYIPLIAAKIAEIKETDIEEVAFVTTSNAKALFAL